ncbi:MAG: SAM-dependent methyltransferase [Glaciihabitans sp.]|nr:SAM-dependent methyltransferase [Glaciihabitans sp.]
MGWRRLYLDGEVTIELLARLRIDLTSADFTVGTLTAVWGEEADAALHRGHRVPARRALDARRVNGTAEAIDTLARLFVLGLPVDPAEAATALATVGVDGARELAIVRASDDGQVWPAVDLRPYSFVEDSGAVDWWIISDLGEISLGHALSENHVLGVGGASLTLSGLMVHNPIDSVLDLGTGCGIQAMHASRHARRVVATDISQRALDFAAMNATLNSITNIEFRLGSLFAPVAGESFDQIVSNPPFVITPRIPGVPAYEYRDGGLVGDALVAEVVAGAAIHLKPGGIAQMLGNWEYHHGVDAFERVGRWIDAARVGSPAGDAAVDAWVVEREVQDAPLYTETWIRDGGTRPGDEFDRLSDAWLDDFAARGVTAVGFGYITLRRPAEQTSPFRRLERLGGAVTGGLGEHVADTLGAHDWQAALDDTALSRALLTVASDVTEERHYWPGDEDPAAITLRQGGAFARVYPMGTVLAAVVGACDGELSIAAICAALAQLLDLREDDVREEVLPAIRELVETGFLLI